MPSHPRPAAPAGSHRADRRHPARLNRAPLALDDDEDQQWETWDEPVGPPSPDWEDFELICPQDEPQPGDHDFWHDDPDDDEYPEAWR